MERTCAMQERSSQFQMSFAKELFVEDFEGMRVFLQESKYVPVPSGAECMLCTITIARNSPILRVLGVDSRKVILVGEAFMGLPHMKKLILLRAEQLRQDQELTKNMSRPDGVASTTLDREIAARQALAWEFKPKLIERTLRGRDGVVVKSSTKVSQGIYANSDDHYRLRKHPIGKGGKEYRCYPMSGSDEADGLIEKIKDFQHLAEKVKNKGDELTEEFKDIQHQIEEWLDEEGPLGAKG